ncbi:vpr protein [Simian immunodeficiency virus]|uniref:Vpr protein n=1 Tax=Simian immunodeficiency virus TaxID=11723 RepID=Q1XE73_SIV|nr:vpr protein [Simian immunodeficiency virus]
MERLPPSHPLPITSRLIPTPRAQLERLMREVRDEMLIHFTREEVIGVWNHCVELPAEPDWTGEQAWAASVIDFARKGNEMLFLHFQQGCFHEQQRRTAHYPNIRPLSGRRNTMQ